MCKKGHPKSESDEYGHCNACRRERYKETYVKKTIVRTGCKHGHPVERKNKHGQCMDCQNEKRRKERRKLTHCLRGHEWIPGQRRCEICRAEKGREAGIKSRSQLSDGYIIFTLKTKNPPKEVIDLKRAYLLLKREVRKCRQLEKS